MTGRRASKPIRRNWRFGSCRPTFHTFISASSISRRTATIHCLLSHDVHAPEVLLTTLTVRGQLHSLVWADTQYLQGLVASEIIHHANDTRRSLCAFSQRSGADLAQRVAGRAGAGWPATSFTAGHAHPLSHPPLSPYLTRRSAQRTADEAGLRLLHDGAESKN
jgi:hypothetical protein